MQDLYGREINYLRVSVTDKCNLRCVYCMPEEGVEVRSHSEFLSFEQIAEVVQAGAEIGIKKIRLTGGEPLVKRGILQLVEMIRRIKDIEHIGMTTNGTLLAKAAAGLKKAGLDSINISLDTLDPARYREITRVGSIERVLEGIEAARAEGFPVKINTVVMN